MREPSLLHPLRPGLRRVACAFLVTLALLYTPAPARANGRFPKAQAIAAVPGSGPGGDGGGILFLRATFGVLVSRDAGASWHWLCEQALGFSSTWDPPIAATRDGRLWVALTDGARVTKDGCTVEDVPALKGELVADLAVDGKGERVFAVTSAPGKPAFVWRSDGARGFTRLGKGVSGFRFDTLEVAPSNDRRVYLTATPEQQGKRAHVFRSDDGGATITELAPVLPNDGRLFVSAVDPRDPDRVLARQLAETGSDVLLSTDGGKTWKSVLHMAGAMFGFARTADGATYYAGGGDPRDGIWRSSDRGATWEPGAKTQVFCLHAEGPSLLVCSNPYQPGGYAVARSTDRGATVTPLARFDDVVGPVACDGGNVCDAPWPETRAAIATSAHAPQPTLDVAPPLAGAGSDAAASSSSPPAAKRSACGCSVVGARGGSPRLPLTAVLGLAVALFVRVRLGAGSRRDGSRAPQMPSRPDHRRTTIEHYQRRSGSRATG